MYRILFFFHFTCLLAEESVPTLGESYVLSNLEGDPSAIVAGCVNVIIVMLQIFIHWNEMIDIFNQWANN